MMRTTPAAAGDRPVRVQLRCDAGYHLGHLRAAAALAVSLVEAEDCRACTHARENHDREYDGGPCSLCDCRGYDGA